MVILCIIFDACTIINILHIDTDDFLNRQLNHFPYLITKCVSDEVNKHAFDKFERQARPDQSEINRIELKINFFRNKIVYPEEYLIYQEEVRTLTGYIKNNEELYSTVLAYVQRHIDEKINVFYTDDGPAKDFFVSFFREQDLGKINDLIDFLEMLVHCGQQFTENDKKKYLSSLFYELGSVIKALEKDLYEFEIPTLLIRNKDFRKLLDNSRRAVLRLDVEDMIKQYQYLIDNKRSYPKLYGIYHKYREFFEQKVSNAYFNKIKVRRR